ncbi:hypothetical protein J2T07_001680 [Luteibacter jiangsuensis]|uniref:DUF1120 domain-containing protein n=1 Tax=Luteibacter jiangsuensis TaxID=637577 RepID=A0ABT9SYW6_9GAMM|nr:DUF1120 domain-containing protein [Luteibacter jiangsuensis]MDQ0009503.1 hypothetical protein [Luteibacter jiangsuensis]
MKYSLMATLALASLAASLHASNVDLQVTGSITPGQACNMTVGKGMDYGRISRNKLNADPSLYTDLGMRRVKMHIDCATPMRYALVSTNVSPRDEAGDAYDLGLFSTANPSSVGSLFVRLDSASAHIEGGSAYYTSADSQELGAAAWGPSTFSSMPIGRASIVIGFVTADGSFDAPGPIGHFDTYLLVHPWIKPMNELALTDDITFSGTLGFEIRYF